MHDARPKIARKIIVNEVYQKKKGGKHKNLCSRHNLGLTPESKAENLPVRSLRSHKLYVVLIFEFYI